MAFSENEKAPKAARVVFIDLLRGWAGLVMIEVHVVNAFVLPATRTESWFPVLNFLNGLVAPSFLFVAGMVFVFVSERKLDQFRSFRGAFWKQLARIGLVWGVGYMLHLPFFSFRRILQETTPEGWLKFYQADVLHCIAAGLLVLFLMRIALKSERGYRVFLWMSTIVVVGCAPFLWDIDFNEYLHPFAGAYLNGTHFSQFPVFPWLGFLFVGGVTGMSLLRAQKAGTEELHMKQVALWGAAAVLAALIVGEQFVVPGGSADIRPQPVFFLLRIGVVFLLLAGLWWYVRFRRTDRSFVLDVSRETLLVYAAHLLIIYGTFWNDRSLAGIYGKSLNLWECAAATVLLSGAMIGLAIAWGRIKAASRPLGRSISFAGALIAFLVFLIR